MGWLNLNAKRKRDIISADERIFMITNVWFHATKSSNAILRAGIRKKYSEIKLLTKKDFVDTKDEVHFALATLDKDVPQSIYMTIDIYKVIIYALKLSHIGEILPEYQNEEIESSKRRVNIKHI
jgi:asparagine synthetase A